MYQKKKSNVAGLLIALGGVALCLLFFVPAMLSGNMLFATAIIPQTPHEIAVYAGGQTFTYKPGDAEYDLLVDAAYDSIATQNGFHEWGWSAERFEAARKEGVAVELFYNEPVKLPGSRVDIGDVYRLFIPLDVFGFTGGNVVFRGGDDTYWGAPLRLGTLDPLRQTVNEIVGEGAVVN